MLGTAKRSRSIATGSTGRLMQFISINCSKY